MFGEKAKILKSNGTYNKRYKAVSKPEFLSGSFYDPMDIIQVKYEMLREAQESGKPIGAVADEFGFSRTAYYTIKEGFQHEGMASLIPEKTGPKQPHKLTEALQAFIDEYLAAHPDANASGITNVIQNENGLTISKRTIERYLAKKKLL